MFALLKLFVFLSLFLSISSVDEGIRAFKGLERLLNFFETDAENLNLDGLYGIRIAQGQLMFLQETFDQPKKIFSNLLKQIDRIGNISLAAIERQQNDYFHRFQLIASRPFLIEFQQRKINEKLIDEGEKNSQFDEEESDRCFSQLILSNSSRCFVEKSCWQLMTSPRSDGYRLTHQLLWFLVAKTLGCVTKSSEKNLRFLEDRFCANIYRDAQLNLAKNENQDLFLEQILLCSIIGYEEFLRPDWLTTILSWQHPEFDCFSDASETIRFSSTKSKRNLLFEQQMKNDCLSHKSGLAAGVLATFVRLKICLNFNCDRWKFSL